MLDVVLLVIAAWLLLTVLGALVLASVAPSLRNRVLPAAPLVGAAFLVAGLHTTGLLLPVRHGLAVVGVAAVVILVIGVRRGTARPYLTRSAVGWTLASVAVGIPFTLVALAPSLILDDPRVVSPTPNHDAIYYVSVSTWLEDNPLVDIPAIGTEPGDGEESDEVAGVIADGPAVSTLTIPLRVGQELVQAALNVATGTSPLVTFTPWMGAWVLLAPGGCVAAAALLRLNRGVGLAAGVLVASSHVLVQQVYNQNAASVLGVVIAPLALAAVVAALDRRVPLLFAGLMLSGLLGIYSEYTPFIGPALVGATLLRRQGFRDAVVRAAGVLICAVLMAPYVWVRAARSLFGVGDAVEAVSASPFRNAPVHVIINRLVGVGPVIAGTEFSYVALVLAAILTVGGILALVLAPYRGLWIGMLAVGVPFLAWLSLEQLGYTQRRAIDILFPLLLVMSVTGWGELIRRLASRGGVPDAEQIGARPARPDAPRPASAAVGSTSGGNAAAVRRWWTGRFGVGLPAVGVSVALLLSLFVWAGVNSRSNLDAFADPDLAPRHLDDSFSDAAAWVREVGGDDGGDVTVLVPGFFDQQWIAMTLADEEDVEYPAVRPDYFRTSSYWSGGTDRYLLVGAGVQVDADPDVEVYGNARFKLLDLTRGNAVVMAPYQLSSWNTVVRPDGGFTTLGNGQALVFRSAGASTVVTVSLRAESVRPFDATVQVAGSPPVVVDELSTEPVDVTLQLPPGDDPVIVDLVRDEPDDPTVQHWIEMAGVRDGR